MSDLIEIPEDSITYDEAHMWSWLPSEWYIRESSCVTSLELMFILTGS